MSDQAAFDRLQELLASASPDVGEVKRLLDSNRMVAHMQTPGKDTALHLAARHVTDQHAAAIVRLLLDRNKWAAGQCNLQGRRPLHCVAGQQFPPPQAAAIVDQLVRADPDGPLAGDEEGSCPLHLAVKTYASLSAAIAPDQRAAVVLALLKAAPQAALRSDKRGLLPLHIAVDSSGPALVEPLLQAMPRAAAMPDKKGRLALHLAVDAHNTTAVKALLKAAPRTAGIRDSSGLLPMHIAAQSYKPLDLLNALLAARPGALLVGDKKGRLPLHIACTNSGHPNIQFFLRADPKTALICDDDGKTPLHLACECSEIDIPMVQLLLEAGPGAVLKVDDTGRTPLHYVAASQSSNSYGVSQMLLAAGPDAPSMADKSGRLPLHYACEKCCDPRVARLLLQTAPAAARVMDLDDKMPLHLACERPDTDAAIIQSLLDIGIEAASKVDKSGRCPLHYLAVSGSELTGELLRAAPQAALIANCVRGRLPLHYACESLKNHQIVATFLEVAPQTSLIADADGQTALHVAVQREEVTLGTIHSLLDAGPEAALKGDSKGWTPLHHLVTTAIGRKAVSPKEFHQLVDLIVAAAPEAPLVADKHGQVPLHYACTRGADPHIAAALLCVAPAATLIADVDGYLPLHTAVSRVSTHLPTIRLLLRAWPQSALQVATNGRTALHCAAAHAAGEKVMLELIRAAPPALLMCDSQGKTPCHFFDASFCPHKVLVEAAPQALLMADGKDRWLRYAHDSDHFNVLRVDRHRHMVINFVSQVLRRLAAPVSGWFLVCMLPVLGFTLCLHYPRLPFLLDCGDNVRSRAVICFSLPVLCLTFMFVG